MLDTIQRMSHKVRTEYGEYNLTYGGDTIPDKIRHLMMRLCQVNSCAPQLWSIISYVVFSALRNQGFGIPFVESFIAEIEQLL